MNTDQRYLLLAAATIYGSRLPNNSYRGGPEMLLAALKDAMELQRMIVFGQPADPPKPPPNPVRAVEAEIRARSAGHLEMQHYDHTRRGFVPK